LETVQKLKKYNLEFKSFNNVDEYIQYFDKFKVLDELASVPFTLRMIMVVLPQIVKFMTEKREKE